MLTVFGSTALDTIRTPKRVLKDVLGGAATFAAISASFFVKPGLIAVVGSDFPKKYASYLSNSIHDRVIEKIQKVENEALSYIVETLEIENYLHKQSVDIALGVDEIENEKAQGAGDQGIMFGYACSETANFMPAPIEFSHKILQTLSKYRHENDSFFGPDSKSQVSVLYENGEPQKITSIVVSTQHTETPSNIEIRKKVTEIIRQALPRETIPNEKEILVNPTGRFVIGGPDGDTGLTGRKIIVDTYGGAAPHGGGAFSGKDYTKVDRSAAYIARYLAKNIVASKVAKKCLIQLSYAIGVSEPISIYLKTDSQSNVNTKKLIEIINDNIDLSPSGIKKLLKLDRPIYEKTATYGHFGRDFCKKTGSFSWERLNFIETILKNY